MLGFDEDLTTVQTPDLPCPFLDNGVSEGDLTGVGHGGSSTVTGHGVGGRSIDILVGRDSDAWKFLLKQCQ